MDACTVMKREKRHNASGISNEGMQFLAMCLFISYHYIYFSSVNCEICSRLVFIRVNLNVSSSKMLTRGRNRAILSTVILIGALVLVPIKVECTLLQAFRDDGKF